jgi:hypothetical protein
MKAYQWLTLSTAIGITRFEGLLFTSTRQIVSPSTPQAAVAVPRADPATSLAREAKGRNSPSKSGAAP